MLAIVGHKKYGFGSLCISGLAFSVAIILKNWKT